MSVDSLVKRGLVERDVPLGSHTTYKSGGPARYLAVAGDEGALQAIAQSGAARDMPVLVMGRGSNLVVSDRGFPGLVVRLEGDFREVKFDEGAVSAGGATPLPRLARAAVDRGRSGLEFFVGIPGSVGGAVRQNAGCFGSETKDVLRESFLFDLADGASSVADPVSLGHSYRHSNLTSTQVVTRATFDAPAGPAGPARDKLREITRWRRDHQPGGTLNAGSVFKNPEGETAGEIIDRLGLKGTRRGDVSVSTKHANFFVAGPDATSADILALVEVVKDRVFEATGTMLVPEIQFVGFDEWP
jgi:UDP-N-acetylmuramate dehydrogenase